MTEETWSWMNEEDVMDFIESFILGMCKQTYSPEIIGEYLALCIPALQETRKEQKSGED